MEKSCRKFAPKLVPDPFLILVNTLKQTLHAKNYFEINILKKNYEKAIKS